LHDLKDCSRDAGRCERLTANMGACKPAIWIDVDNSPHVPLFAPVIRHFRSNDVTVLLTARDHSQTIELLDLHGFSGTYTVVGTHAGGSKLKKIAGLVSRASQLARFIKKSGVKPAVAVSHGSRSMVLAARWLKIPVITMYDYEHTETWIFNRFSTRVLVPEMIRNEALDAIGLKPGRRVKYPGLKEEIYLHYFSPTTNFRKKLAVELGFAITDATVLAVLRPPATTANYHDPKSEEIFDAILKRINGSENTLAVIVPRTSEQRHEVEQLLERGRYSKKRLIVLKHAVNGLDLADAADLMISGGGTMNREAALLGVPVYSIFSGRLGSIDAQMESDGRINFIRERSQIEDIDLISRDRSDSSGVNIPDRVERFVIEQINSFVSRA